jgi:molecular chaperone GrpE
MTDTTSPEPKISAPKEGEDSLEAMGEAQPRFKVNDRRFWTLDEKELEEDIEHPHQPSYIETIQKQLEEKDRQLKEYIAAYKKEVVEELEKTKQRLERDSANQLEQQRGQLALPMIEVLDALERSLAAAESSAPNDALVQGVRMVYQLMVQKLCEFGLNRIETMGVPFDPSIHEAAGVVIVSDPEKNNRVMAEFKPGFTLGNRVIRPALVQVGKCQ